MNNDRFYQQTKERIERIDYLNASEEDLIFLTKLQCAEFWPDDDLETHVTWYTDMNRLWDDKLPSLSEVKEALSLHIAKDKIDRLESLSEYTENPFWPALVGKDGLVLWGRGGGVTTVDQWFAWWEKDSASDIKIFLESCHPEVSLQGMNDNDPYSLQCLVEKLHGCHG
jgi:hypothetical protein